MFAITPERETCPPSNLPKLRALTERLAKNEARLNDLYTALELAAEGIARLDSQGRYVEVNETYARICGYKPSEMIGQLWPMTIHFEDRERALAAYHTALKNAPTRVEVRGTRKDGSDLWKEITIVRSGNNHFCLMRDITHRKNNEENIRKLSQEIARLQVVNPAGQRPCSDCPLNLNVPVIE